MRSGEGDPRRAPTRSAVFFPSWQRAAGACADVQSARAEALPAAGLEAERAIQEGQRQPAPATVRRGNKVPHCLLPATQSIVAVPCSVSPAPPLSTRSRNGSNKIYTLKHQAYSLEEVWAMHVYAYGTICEQSSQDRDQQTQGQRTWGHCMVVLDVVGGWRRHSGSGKHSLIGSAPPTGVFSFRFRHSAKGAF